MLGKLDLLTPERGKRQVGNPKVPGATRSGLTHAISIGWRGGRVDAACSGDGRSGLKAGCGTERISLIGALPCEVLACAAKVPIGSCLLVDRAV